MKRWINILVGLFAVQVAIFALLSYRDLSTGNAVSKAEALLSVNFDKVEKFVIENADKKTLEIVKKEGKFVIPSYFNFPVPAEKIQQVFKHLAEAKRSYPLGNTKVAAKQFEVTDDRFERKIQYYVGDKVANTLYLGGSPGYRKVYARVDEEEKTYSVEFNTLDCPTEAKDWTDHDIYKFDRSKVASIKLNDFTFTREGSEFKVSNLKADEVTNATEADNFINRIQNPAFEEVLAVGAYEQGAKLLEYTVSNDDKSERHFVYSEFKAEAKASHAKKPGEKEEPKTEAEFAVLKVSDLPYFFKVRKARVDELMKFQHSTFVKKKDTAETKQGQNLGKEAGQLDTGANGPG